jgi:hypothetical protein
MKRRQLTMNQLEQKMRVLVHDYCSGQTRSGTITKVVISDACRMIDGKPVRKRQNIQATIVYDREKEEVILTSENFEGYQVTRQ